MIQARSASTEESNNYYIFIWWRGKDQKTYHSVWPVALTHEGIAALTTKVDWSFLNLWRRTAETLRQPQPVRLDTIEVEIGTYIRSVSFDVRLIPAVRSGSIVSVVLRAFSCDSIIVLMAN